MRRKRMYHEFDYYVLLFFSLAFVGWMWEVVLYFFTEHAFINRGVYRGPYLPVYGAGGLLLCLVCRPWGSPGKRFSVKKILGVFGFSAIACSAVEYLTSYFLELRWGIRWWDYRGHFLNVNGRICLTGAVAFGIGGVVLVCLFLPFYERMYAKISEKMRIWICLLLLGVFVADAAYCAMHPNVGYGIATVQP